MRGVCCCAETIFAARTVCEQPRRHEGEQLYHTRRGRRCCLFVAIDERKEAYTIWQIRMQRYSTIPCCGEILLVRVILCNACHLFLLVRLPACNV